MTARKACLAVAIVAMLVTGACTDSQDPPDLVAPTATTPASGTTRPATEPTRRLRLVVLGESNAHRTSCSGCSVFAEQVATALGDALGSMVEVRNLAWLLTNPKAAEVADVRTYVATDDVARREIARADAIVIHVFQNDLAYNRPDDPCGVAPHYPRVRWADLTHACMDRVLAESRRDMEGLLDEIDALRAGRPTMLRIVTGLNTALGDVVDPTWSSPAAVNPTTYHVRRMVDMQCRLAARHGGSCADIYHVLNGRDGQDSAQRFLNPYDATHLTQAGHDKVADIVIRLGFEPLR